VAVAFEQKLRVCKKEKLTIVVRSVDHGWVENHGEELLGELALFEGLQGEVVVVDAST
jgi:hypothetical protein